MIWERLHISDKMSQHKNWQELLDFLTSKAKQDGTLRKIENGEENIISFCFKNEFYKNKLLQWIMSTDSMVLRGKSSSKASSFRQLGNDKFRLKDNHGSLLMYSESIRYAFDHGEDLSLALANRSAALFHMQCYEECLKDIELAFAKCYPPHLHYKLHIRQGQSLLKLEKYKDAVNAFYSAQKSLKDVLDCKKHSVELDIEKALSEALSHTHVENSNTTPRKDSAYQLPLPTYGDNQIFLYASKALDLRYDYKKGRHVLTNRDIKRGDILFVEKPYTFVVLPDQYRTHCHHCCKTYIAPIPCWECTEGLFCSDSCRKESWEQYHRWECRGLELMHSIGIAHLGLRVVLKVGSLDKLRNYNAILKTSASQEGSYGDKEDNYPAVYQLMTHLEDMQPEDRLQYGLTAALLTLYLNHHSDYFKRNTNGRESDIIVGTKSDGMADDILLVGERILHHIAQLVCNGHAITKLDVSSSDPEQSSVVTESQVRIATAIYPSASMMNHSCEPNIINSFCDQHLVVRASKDILKGEEVYNCYGPHFRRMSRQDRQEVLKCQYFFTCDCDHCSQLVQCDFQERFSALLCSSCGGPLVEKENMKQSDINTTHQMICSDCGDSQGYSKLVEMAFRAHGHFNEGCTSLQLGNVKEALQKFKIAWKLQKECLYRSNKDLTVCLDHIAKCYAMLGDYDKSVEYLLLSIPAVEEQFGLHSIELANELQKLSDVMICDLQHGTYCNSTFMKKHKKTLDYVNQAKQILSLHYGIWNTGLQQILEKEELLMKILRSE